MIEKGLWVLVEGDDDERLIKYIERELIEGRYLWIKAYQYACKSHNDIASFLRNLNKMGADYIFLRDLDSEVCVTRRKERVSGKYQELDNTRILIVRREIEAWYIAGLDEGSCRDLGMHHALSTDEIRKEDFYSLMPKRFTSRIDFMREILKRFSVDIAKNKNTSFAYFLDKHFS